MEPTGATPTSPPFAPNAPAQPAVVLPPSPEPALVHPHEHAPKLWAILLSLAVLFILIVTVLYFWGAALAARGT